MSVFERVVNLVIELEGGDVVTRDPAGGLTRFGISQVYHSDIDVERLSRDDAVKIYRKEYWDRVRGDELPPALAMCVMDGAVIPGLGWAAPALQNVLGVEEDGIIGVRTILAAKATGWHAVVEFTGSRMDEFNRRVRLYPYMSKYIHGWRDRCLRVFRESVRLECGVE